MSFTRVVGPGIHTQANIDSHNIHSTGIITAVSFVGNLTGGASSITGTPPVSLGNVNAGIATFRGALSGTTANFSGNVTVGGVLTYEDVKNVDSVGLGTFREGIFIPDNKKLEIGNASGSGDLQLYHDTNHSYIDDAGTGNLKLRSGTIEVSNLAGSKTSAVFNSGSSQDLYFNNVKKFETSEKGIKIGAGVTIETNGQATFVGVVTFGSSSTTIDGDANTIKVGTALTLGHTQGIQFHNQRIHSAGFEVNQITATGIVTASKFIGAIEGDGSLLTGVSGFSTALSNDTTSLLNLIFRTNAEYNVLPGTNVYIQSDAGSGNVAFTRLNRINVQSGAMIRVAAGTIFKMNVLNVF